MNRMERAQTIQDQLNKLQLDFHDKLEQRLEAHIKACNVIYDSRNKVIEKYMAEEKVKPGTGLPANFWAKAILSGMRCLEKELGEDNQFLGPYDEELLLEYLESMDVEHTPKAQKLRFHFKPNPFFKEKCLWASLEYSDADEEDEEDEMDSQDDEEWSFSGVTWLKGHGPQDEEDEGKEISSDKRGRDADSSGKKGTTRGPSFLEVFQTMPPSPHRDMELLNILQEEGIKEEDIYGEIEEAQVQWEAEMDDRKKVIAILMHEVYENPLLEEAVSTGEKESKKFKAES